MTEVLFCTGNAEKFANAQLVCDSHGIVITQQKQIKGHYGAAYHKLVSLEGDNGLSIAEIYDKGLNKSDRHAAGIWHEFVTWYTS